MRTIKLLLFLASFSVLIQLTYGNAYANEGTVSMKNEELNTTCIATSVYVTGSFKILIRCSNLIYPPPPGGYYYSVWSDDEDEGLTRLGDLGYGREDYNTRSAFKSLTVTSETSNNPTKPSENVVMTGNITPFEFDRVEVQEREVTPINQVEQPKETPTPSGTITKLLTFLKNLGLITGAVILVGALVFFVISRIRRAS